MTPARVLRDYQVEAVSHLRGGFAAGARRIPMVLATGLGKTEIFTDPTLLDEYLNAGKRVLVIAHTDELIDQAAKAARRNNPGRRVGIVKAQQNEVTAQIVVSSRQTLGHAAGGPRRLKQLRNVGLIVIDEAHHALRTNTYGKILEHFGCFCEPDRKRPGRCMQHITDCHPHVAGFTATLARGDKGKLSSVWQMPEDGRLFRRDILFGIRRGYLLDVSGKRVVVPDLDMGRVKTVNGDYQDSSMAEELERTYAAEVIAEAYLKEARDRHGALRRGIAFWPLVETAYHAAEVFSKAGIPSETIHGELPKPERRAMLRRLHTGETLVIHGVNVLTEGFDEPLCDVVIPGRTKSGGRYQQQVGRVLRPDLTKRPEDREKALILDVVGVGTQHDLRSLIDLSPERPLNPERAEELSLLQLEDELIGLEEARGSASIEIPEEVWTGDTEVREFDPLGRTRAWQRTPGGAYFMSAGTVGYVFLVESLAGEPAHFDVVLCSKLSYPRDGVQPWARATEHTDLPLEMALGYAEELALDVGGHGTKSLTSRKSAWRKAPAKPGPERLARMFGVWRDGMNAGECAEAIDLAKAAQRIDPLVHAVKRAYSE